MLIGGAVILFINPNNFKQEATDLIQDYTGQPFEITGPISYSLWPKLIVKFQDLSLKTPAVEIKQANIYIDPYSILGNHLTINNLELTEVKATISGLGPIPAIQLKDQMKIEAASVDKSLLVIKNDQNKLNWELRDLSFTAKNIDLASPAPFEPISFSGTLVNMNSAASVAIDGALTADLSKQTMSFKPINVNWNETKAHGDALLSQYAANPTVAGNLTIDQTNITDLLKKLDPYFAKSDNQATNILQASMAYSYSMQDEFLDLTQLNLKIDDGSLVGSLKVKFTSPYRSEFELTADKLDFEPLLLLTKAVFPTVPTSSIIPVDSIKAITIMGKISGTGMKLTPDFAVDSLSAEIIAKDGLVQVNPLVVSAYGGTHNLNLSLDVNAALPSVKVVEQSEGFQIEPWVKLLDFPKVLSGDAKLKLSVSSQGNTIDALKEGITGGVNLSINHGTVYGIDLAKLMQYITSTVDSTFEQMPSNKTISLHDQLQPKLMKWLDTQKGDPATQIDTLTFDADLKQGVSLSSSFDLNNATYGFKGTGSWNVVNDEINYSGVLSNKGDVTSHLAEIGTIMTAAPLTIPMSGTFVKPILTPNIEEYITNILKQTQVVLIKKAAGSMVAAAPANDKTTKAAEEIFVDSLKGLSK